VPPFRPAPFFARLISRIVRSSKPFSPGTKLTPSCTRRRSPRAKSVREPRSSTPQRGLRRESARCRHRHASKNYFLFHRCTYGEPEIVPFPKHRKAPSSYGKSKLVFEEILADYKLYTGSNMFLAIQRRRARRSVASIIAWRRISSRVLDGAAGDLPMSTSSARITPRRRTCVAITPCARYRRFPRPRP